MQKVGGMSMPAGSKPHVPRKLEAYKKVIQNVRHVYNNDLNKNGVCSTHVYISGVRLFSYE